MTMDLLTITGQHASVARATASSRDFDDSDLSASTPDPSSEDAPVSVLKRSYLLVTNIPCYHDEAGSRWLDQAWHHDLMEHLTYIENFTLCAPLLPKSTEPNLVRVGTPEGAQLRFADLPALSSMFKALLLLPRTVAALWRAIGRVEIVHSGIVGWPYPFGWIANPIAKLRGKGLVIVVESSWRRGDEATEPQTWKIRMLNTAMDFMAHWSCKHADVALFTHSTYRDILHSGSGGSSYVTPAVWINEADILDDAIAEVSWQQKAASPVRMLFAGRLTANKGVDVLLAALRVLDDWGVKAQVDIIGQGDRRQICEQAMGTFRQTHLSVLDPVPYGPPFFELVRGYHALLLPSLTDEQPRVIFDVNSQAVPVLASDTPGIRPHVDHGRTGWLFSRGDAELLASAMEHAIASPQELRGMGMAALAATRGRTHVAMHRNRSQILRRHFSSSDGREDIRRH